MKPEIAAVALVATVLFATSIQAQVTMDVVHVNAHTVTASLPGLPPVTRTAPSGSLTLPYTSTAVAAETEIPFVSVRAQSRIDRIHRGFASEFVIEDRAWTVTTAPGAMASSGYHETRIDITAPVALVAELEISWIGASTGGASTTADVDVFDDGTIDFVGAPGVAPLRVPLRTGAGVTSIRAITRAVAGQTLANAFSQLTLIVRPTRDVRPTTGCWRSNALLRGSPALDGSLEILVDNTQPRGQPVFLVLGFQRAPRPLLIPERTGHCLLEPSPDVVLPLGTSDYLYITLPPYTAAVSPFSVFLQAVRLDISAVVADLSGFTEVVY